MIFGFVASVSMQLVFLGTGTPRQDPQRSGPCTAVIFGDESFLVDCGPGVCRRAAAAQKLGFPQLSQKNLRRVFITHLHSDHTLGYPDLIFSPWVVGRTNPVEAYGPVGLKRMTSNLESAFSEDVSVRTEGLEHGNKTGYKVHVHEIRPGVVYQEPGLTVTAFPVKHGSWKFAYGYRFETATNSIVFSGDTSPCSSLEEAAMGCDILVHEVYSDDEQVREGRSGGEDWPKYLHEFHTSAQELGQIALRCHPKILVLTHILRQKTTDEELVEEVRKGGYQGQIIVARDLQTVTP